MTTFAVYDIEADGLLMDATVVHCLVIYDIQTGEYFEYRPDEIIQGIEKLKGYDRIIGHNERMYDRKVLQRLYPAQAADLPTSIDTLLISRVWFPDMYTNPVGGHALKDWGLFLGEEKWEHKEWDQFSEEMLAYCKQDVKVQTKVYEYLLPCAMKIKQAVRLEHEVADVIADQIINGVTPDAEAIRDLLKKTSAETRRILEELQRLLPPKMEEMKAPAYWYVETGPTGNDVHQEPTKTALLAWIRANPWVNCGEVKRGPPRKKVIPFNPGSPKQIAERFTEKYGWKPSETTDGGQPCVDDNILKTLPYPEAALLREYRIVKDREEKAIEWESRIRVDTGRIHGGISTNGTVTGRMSHSQPNLAQVPKVSKPWGKECRSCFRAGHGKVFVGADASGLELRMFAHFVARWDGGAYARLLLESDIHIHNQHLAGLPDRESSKTFIYGLFYGAGDKKLGLITNGTAAEGRKLRHTFMERLPAYGHLSEWIEFQRRKYGILIGLDGRRLPVRSPHMALNTLLQSAGAVIMKKALVILARKIKEQKLDAKFCLNVHDEWQIECDRKIADKVGQLAVDSIREAGEFFNLSCPLTGEYKIGLTWKDTH